MIPKIIHYCWFGPYKIPKIIKRNISNWHRMCPNYKIVKWSENNFNVTSTPFTYKAYKERNWAFVSDYVRLYALKKYGGIYLDTDVKIIKPFTPLLYNDMFLGLENWDSIGSGLAIGSIPNEKNIRSILSIYSNIGDRQSSLNKVTDTTTKIITNYFRLKGFRCMDKKQCINNCVIYPTEYFCPQSRITGKTRITNNTYSIHYYYNSWTGKDIDKKVLNHIRVGDFLKKILRPRLYDYLYSIYLRYIKNN